MTAPFVKNFLRCRHNIALLAALLVCISDTAVAADDRNSSEIAAAALSHTAAGEHRQAAMLVEQLFERGYDGEALRALAGKLAEERGESGEALYHYRIGSRFSPSLQKAVARLRTARDSAPVAQGAPGSPPPMSFMLAGSLFLWLVAWTLYFTSFWGRTLLAALCGGGALAGLLLVGFGSETVSGRLALGWTPQRIAVVRSVTAARSTPELTAPVVEMVPAAAEVAILRDRDGFLQIALPNGRTGWLEATHVLLLPPV